MNSNVNGLTLVPGHSPRLYKTFGSRMIGVPFLGTVSHCRLWACVLHPYEDLPGKGATLALPSWRTLRSVTAAGGLLLAVPNLTSAQQQNFAWDNYYTVGSLDFC